jgi:hypothetical protein
MIAETQLGQTFYGAAFSPDGTQLAYGVITHDGVQIAPTPTAQLDRPDGDDIISVVEVSPDGTYIAISRQSGKIELLDSSGTLMATIRQDGLQALAISWSPDSAGFVSGDGDGLVQIWNVPNGDLELLLEDAVEAVNSVDWSPDGTKIVTSTPSHNVHIWDAASGNLLYELIPGETYHVAWSPDGAKVATVGFWVTVWDAATQQKLIDFKTPNFEIFVDWNQSGSAFVTTSLGIAGDAFSATVWDATDGQAISSFAEHNDLITAAKWSPVDDTIATGSLDGKIYFWNAQTGEIVGLIETPDPIYAFDWFPDGSKIAYSGADGRTIVANVPAPPAHDSAGSPYAPTADAVRAIDWHPDGVALAKAMQNGSFEIIDTSTGDTLFTYNNGDNPASAIKWNVGGTRLAVGIGLNVFVFDFTTSFTQPRLVFNSAGHASEILSLAWNPLDSSALASVSILGPQQLFIWDIINGTPTVSAPLPQTGALSWGCYTNQLVGAAGIGIRVIDISTGNQT